MAHRALKITASIVASLLLLIVGNPGPAEAGDVRRVTIKVTDYNGDPAPRVGIYYHSYLGAKTLDSWVSTNSAGVVKVPSYPDFQFVIGPQGDSRCISAGARQDGSLEPGQTLIETTVPVAEDITFHVTSTSGYPVMDAQATILWRDFGNGFTCDQPSKKTDANGIAVVDNYAGGQPTSFRGSGVIYYGFGTDNMQSVFFDESAIVNDRVEIVLDAIDEVSLDAPATVSANQNFDVVGNLSADNSTLSIRTLSFRTLAVSAPSVTLYQRAKSGSKWSAWKKVKSASVSGSTVRFKKLKLSKGIHQLQVRQTNTTIGAEIQTIRVR